MKVEKDLELSGPPADAEYITDEERHMFRKVGLKMKAFLLIGVHRTSSPPFPLQVFSKLFLSHSGCYYTCRPKRSI